MTKRTNVAIAIPVSTPVLALRPIAWRDQAERLLGYAEPISRIGPYVSLAIIYAWFGGMKFTAYEAEGLVALVQNSPLVSWFYALLSVRGFSTFLGFVELSIGLLIVLRLVNPVFSAAGGLLSSRTVRHHSQLHDLDAGRRGAGARGARDLGRARSVPPQGRRPSRGFLLGIRQLAEISGPKVNASAVLMQAKENIMSKRLDYNQIAPAGVKALGGVYGYVMQSGLSAVLVDLVYLRISQINNCAYCLDMHTRDLIKKGVKIEKLALVQAWREAGNLFDAREGAALAWAETVTRVAETNVPVEACQAARAVFSEKELVDLTIAIGLMNTYNRLAISFRNTPQAVVEQQGKTQAA